MNWSVGLFCSLVAVDGWWVGVEGRVVDLRVNGLVGLFVCGLLWKIDGLVWRVVWLVRE